MIKILTIVGTRPQFIKAATISRLIQELYKKNIQEIIVHTGQHYDKGMSDIFFEEMSIPTPHYLLETGGKLHGDMTGLMIIELEKIMMSEKPDIVLIYGDTNSTLAAAISAAKLNLPIAHIEAGMRSGHKKMPEEINRILSDHVSTYFFCTTEEPANNLKQENIKEHIYVVGDVMYDAVLFYKNHAKKPACVDSLPKKFCLVTCHRQENTNDPKRLEQIFDALKKISSDDTKILLPLHPRTKKYLDAYGISTEGLIITPPISYLEMIYCLEKAEMVITDSGGLQREAYYLKKPVILINEQTEWKELITHKVALLAGACSEQILSARDELLSVLLSWPKNIYGDGTAAHQILSILSNHQI